MAGTLGDLTVMQDFFIFGVLAMLALFWVTRHLQSRDAARVILSLQTIPLLAYVASRGSFYSVSLCSTCSRRTTSADSKMRSLVPQSAMGRHCWYGRAQLNTLNWLQQSPLPRSYWRWYNCYHYDHWLTPTVVREGY